MNGIIGAIYGFVNVLFMMWFGYGGAKFLAIPDSVLFIAVGYLITSIVMVYLPLWTTNEGARKAAIIGLLPPWVFIIIITLPQEEASEMLMFAGSIIACLLLTRKPIEKYIASVKA